MGGTTGSANFDVQADGTAYVRLDPVTVRLLEDASRASKKGPAQLIKQAIEDWREREFDRKALARIKKRKPGDPAKAISHADLKKSLGDLHSADRRAKNDKAAKKFPSGQPVAPRANWLNQTVKGRVVNEA